MNNVSKNQVNAIRATIQFCVNHADATKGIPAFAVALQTASNKLLLIDQLDQLASTTTKGVTLDTNALRLSMELQALKCANAVMAYATSVNNNTLKASVNFTKAKMEKMRKDEVDDTCQTIIEAAQKYFDNAKNFGIDENDVNDLKTTISLYRTSVQNPRQAIIAKADANKQIKELIREVLDVIFKGVMDAMVRTLEKSNPSFVTQYFYAREILDLGTRHTGFRGVILNNDKKPIERAVVKLLKEGSSETAYETQTNAKGEYIIESISPTYYDCVVNAFDYVPFSEKGIQFNSGKDVKREYIMNRS